MRPQGNMIEWIAIGGLAFAVIWNRVQIYRLHKMLEVIDELVDKSTYDDFVERAKQ